MYMYIYIYTYIHISLSLSIYIYIYIYVCMGDFRIKVNFRCKVSASVSFRDLKVNFRILR